MDKYKTLYRFIKDDYDMHTALESATKAIAKKRAKKSFTREKALKIYMLLVYNAKSYYNKSVAVTKRLPRFNEDDRKVVAEALYKDEQKAIERLTKLYKKP